MNIAYGVVRMIGYAMLCIDDAITCWICSAMYRWCCVHVVHVVLCTYGVLCMLCCVHVVQVALCAGDVVYMLCMWRCVHVVSRTCHACGTVYMWYCVHVVQWCNVYMVLCTHCVGGVVYM